MRQDVTQEGGGRVVMCDRSHSPGQVVLGTCMQEGLKGICKGGHIQVTISRSQKLGVHIMGVG